MRKRALILAISGAFILILSLSLCAFAQENKPAADPAAARKAAEERARVKLGAKEWNVEAKSTDPASRVKPWSDVLNLNEGKLNSKHLGEKGFASSNISVTAEGERIVWETMQRGGKGEIAFWRGELAGDAMNGVVSIKPEKGETEEFSFTTNVPLPPPKPVAKPAESQKKAEPVKKGKK